MIKCYTWTTPNGYKVPIMLEEAGMEYELHMVNIREGEQHEEEYLKINPNNKIPAIIDTDGPGGESLRVFESGAVLWYLAEKSSKFLPKDEKEKYETLSWLFMQVGSVGPMMGQLHHFGKYAEEKIPYAIDRYMSETERILGVLDRRLAESEYLARDYGIADIATWTWVREIKEESSEITSEMYPHVVKWVDAIACRPAVIRGIEATDKAKEANDV